MENKYQPIIDLLSGKREEEEQLFTPIKKQGLEYPKQEEIQVPETAAEVDQEEVNDIVESANAPKEEVQVDPREEMLRQLKTAQAQRDRDLKAKRDLDRQSNLMRDLHNSFVGVNQALASGPAKIDLSSHKIKPMSNEAEIVEKDYDTKLDDMMREYKLLSKDDKSELTPYQQKALELQEKRLELLGNKENRLTKKDKFQEGIKQRLSDKEVESISGFDDGVRILDEIDDVLQNTDVEKDLGPYASRIEQASTYIPGVEKDRDFVKAQQLVGIQLADYVKSISGAQVSEQEAQRLLKNIPNMTDKPNEFKIKLKTFRKELADMKKDYLKNIGKQKKNAELFQDKNNKTESDTVLLQAPNGQTKRVRKEMVQKYLDKGATVIEE